MRSKVLKTLLKHSVFWSALSLTQVGVQAVEFIDKAVAIVGEDVILESDLRRRINHVHFLFPESVKEDTQVIETRVMDQLVDERLQFEIAERNNLKVSVDRINSALQTFKNQLRRSGRQYADYLNKVGGDENTVREQIRTDLLIQTIQQGVLNQRITITDTEVNQFLESREGQEWLRPKFNVGHILLPVSTGADEQAVLSQAQNLHQQLDNNFADFRQLAQQFSGGPNAAKGGDLGWRSKDQLPESFFLELNPLRPEQISRVFRSNAGFHILKLYERSGAEAVFIERYKTRHILIKVTELFSESEAQRKINELFEQVSNGADFEELARNNTDDTASKLSGGDLGWSSPGLFVPEFERVMKLTAIGEISPPFRSPFGWHILKVEGERTEDIFEQVKDNQVKSILRNRRFQDELQLWLQELRENTFIKKIS